MKVYIQQGKDEIKTTIKILERAKPNIENKVLIKPNLTLPASPDSNICTSLRVIEGIIQYLRNIGIKDVIVGEGAGGAKDMSKIFKITGYKELSERLNVPLINLNQDKTIELEVNDSYFLDKIKVSKTVFGRYVINVPKMKTHRLAIVSLALKNMMGVILPYNKKSILHPKYNEINEKIKLGERDKYIKEEFEMIKEDFFKRLVDFYSVLRSVCKPNLNIIDGIIGKQGDGLTHGRNIRTNYILLSDDIIAIDYVASYLIGLNLSDLYLKYIKGKKINKLSDINIITNVEINKLRKKFKPILMTKEVYL